MHTYYILHSELFDIHSEQKVSDGHLFTISRFEYVLYTKLFSIQTGLYYTTFFILGRLGQHLGSPRACGPKMSFCGSFSQSKASKSIMYASSLNTMG